MAILPTMGGQTALNCALDLNKAGVLKKYDIEMIGAKPEVIEKAEDRLLFRQAMEKIGLESPRSRIATTREEALAAYRASEMSKAAILNSVAATVAVVDCHGVILEVNDPWRRFALENGAEPGKPAAGPPPPA
jgi:PAS domain-containing protein